jgi:hypothetical protein
VNEAGASAPIAPQSSELDERPAVKLGVVVSPGLAHEITVDVATDLAEDLGDPRDEVEWRTEFVVDRLVEPPVPTTELIDAARRRLLEGDWDLAVVVTDLPLRVGGQPVSYHSSPTHGIAIVSLPALGAFQLRRRLRKVLHELVEELVGGDVGREHALRELANDTLDRPGALRLLFVPSVLAGHLRLLAGMVRANRPWRFAIRLYAALVAALAVGAYGATSSDIWRLSGSAQSWRLLLMSLVSVAATSAAIIAVHGLWERVPDPRVREQVVLFNIATLATVVVGIATLYAALFVLILAGAALVIPESVFDDAVVGSVTAADYAALAWFVASLATIGGALGAGLESREAVREAAYASNFTESEPALTEEGTS